MTSHDRITLAETVRIAKPRPEHITQPVERPYAARIAKARTWPAYVAVCAVAAAAGGGLVWVMAALAARQ